MEHVASHTGQTAGYTDQLQQALRQTEIEKKHETKQPADQKEQDVDDEDDEEMTAEDKAFLGEEEDDGPIDLQAALAATAPKFVPRANPSTAKTFSEPKLLAVRTKKKTAARPSQQKEKRRLAPVQVQGSSAGAFAAATPTGKPKNRRVELMSVSAP